MSHSSSRWHETSISSVIPKHIVDPRKRSLSDITIPIIHTSLSPSFYSPENWRRAPEIYRLFTPWKRCRQHLTNPADRGGVRRVGSVVRGVPVPRTNRTTPGAGKVGIIGLTPSRSLGIDPKAGDA